MRLFNSAEGRADLAYYEGWADSACCEGRANSDYNEGRTNSACGEGRVNLAYDEGRADLTHVEGWGWADSRLESIQISTEGWVDSDLDWGSRRFGLSSQFDLDRRSRCVFWVKCRDESIKVEGRDKSTETKDPNELVWVEVREDFIGYDN